MKTELQQILMLAFNIVNIMITTPEKKFGKNKDSKQFVKNRDQLLKKEGIITLHESVIGLIYDKAQKKNRD